MVSAARPRAAPRPTPPPASVVAWAAAAPQARLRLPPSSDVRRSGLIALLDTSLASVAAARVRQVQKAKKLQGA